MKKSIFTALIIFIATYLPAQDYETPYDIKGNELLKKASEKIQSYKSLKIEFTYEMENNSMEIHETMSGVLFSEGKKYYMEVGDNVFISDGTNIWNYIDDMEEVQISNAEDVEDGLTPTAIIQDFQEHFRATFIKQETHEGKIVDIIDLIPNISQAFFKYRLALDAKDQMIVYSIAYDRHGGTFTYKIDKIEPNILIPANKFTFDKDKFPGVFINDLR